MDNIFYTNHQWKIFAKDLFEAFVKLGFEVIEKPYIDDLGGFRATYIRRYFLQYPTTLYDGSLVTLIHVVGKQFGSLSQKMVILSSPRNVNNEPVCQTLKLRLQIGLDGSHVVQGDHITNHADQKYNADHMFFSESSPSSFEFESPLQQQMEQESVNQLDSNKRLAEDLANYVSHIIEMISPGLIQLPVEMKLEILKRLSVGSIIRMSQVNIEFKNLIFQHGESLWRHLCYRDFNIKIINRGRYRSWMELYKELYMINQIELCRKERALPGLPDRPALPPAPYRLQIEWLPEAIEPFYAPIDFELHMHPINERLPPALQLPALRRAESLDGFPI